MADLGGRTLAVEFGTQGDLEARKWARRLPGLAVVPFQTAAEALAAVTAGEAGAALVDHVSALAATARPGSATSRTERGLVVVGQPVVEEPYAVAVRRESQHLLRAVNRALVEMEADGTMEALIYGRYGNLPYYGRYGNLPYSWCRIWLRNSLVRSSLGAVNNNLGVVSSTMEP
jgi:ABC-type amino acid transport substrate-binding protein